MEDSENIKKSINDTKKYITDTLNMFNRYKNFVGKLEENEEKEFKELENELEQNYKRFQNISRFSIPIIGMISSGKSTFLNFLLGIDCLETNFDISTKCVVIIRHNNDLQDKKYIYSVTIKEINNGYYKFEPDINTKSEDLKGIIKQRNDLIKNSPENDIKKEDFFLIIEANIPLFNGKNNKYANFFEFLDLPGLDEGENEPNNKKNSNIFRQQILPKIASNSLFSILIFDASKYMSENNPEIFKDYLRRYFKNKFNNSFFILNKIDLLDKEEDIKKFDEEMLVKKLNINLEEKSIHIKYLSCKILTIELKKYENFQSYLKFLLTNKGEEKNLLSYLQKKFKEEFNKDIINMPNDSPNENQKKRIFKNIKELNKENKNFKTLINFKEYYNYEKFFDALKLKGTIIENEAHNKLYDEFNQSFFNSINNFIDIQKDQSLSNRIKKIEEKLGKISKSDKEDIKRNKKNINFLKKLSNNYDISFEIFQKLKPIVDKLSESDDNLTIFKNLKDEYETIEFFIKKNKKLRIPIFGKYSTGKSSILNCIIGKKILPEGNLPTTNKIIVIRNNDENKYILSNAKFEPINKDEDYYCFEENEIILNCDESNYNDIYKYLEEKNNDKNDENEIYLLLAPISMFKTMIMDNEILNKIELIDFPGINVNAPIINKNFHKLIQLSDTFIFVNDFIIKDEDNISSIKKIVDRIERRKFDFDYNSCLFVLNKADLDDNLTDNNIEEIKNIFHNTVN